MIWVGGKPYRRDFLSVNVDNRLAGRGIEEPRDVQGGLFAVGADGQEPVWATLSLGRSSVRLLVLSILHSNRTSFVLKYIRSLFT